MVLVPKITSSDARSNEYESAEMLNKSAILSKFFIVFSPLFDLNIYYLLILMVSNYTIEKQEFFS